MKRVLLPVLMGFVLLLLSSTEGWGLPFCLDSYNSTTWTDCFGTYTSADRIMYVGEWQNGKRRGQGTFTHWGGRIQEGIWENDNFKSPYPTTLESLIKTENDPLINFKGRLWLVRQWLEQKVLHSGNWKKNINRPNMTNSTNKLS